MQLPDALREKQLAFRFTGGIHAAALFNFKGEIEQLNPEENEVVVSVDVFSRKTNVTLTINEIELLLR